MKILGSTAGGRSRVVSRRTRAPSVVGLDPAPSTAAASASESSTNTANWQVPIEANVGSTQVDLARLARVRMEMVAGTRIVSAGGGFVAHSGGPL
jgi:hypothetical protein